MKKMMIMAMMMAIAISASAMTYGNARTEALFLSDKMAYELGLTKSQYEMVYEINLDYLMCVSRQSDLFGTYWTRRNNDLRHVLSAYQFRIYQRADYFYRPLKWQNKSWTMTVYSRYSNRNKMYVGKPSGYSTYKGGNNRGSVSKYKNRGVQKPSSHSSGTKGGTSTGKSGTGKSGSSTSFDHNMGGSHGTGSGSKGSGNSSGKGSSKGSQPKRVFR